MSFFKAIWKGNSRHKKLYDEWALASSNDTESISETPPEEEKFQVKYLGSTLVEKPSSEEATAEAVNTVLSMVKASGKKLPRVEMHVSLTGIKLVDLATQEIHLNMSIYRISYCSADAVHSHVFAFIATNTNETLECHAFLCAKRKMAQTLSLTVAQYFNTAYEIWQLSQDKLMHESKKRLSLMREQQARARVENKTMLIDFGAEPNMNKNHLRAWESFEDEPTETVDFSKLDNEKRLPTFPSDNFSQKPNLWGVPATGIPSLSSHREESRRNLLCS